MGRDLPLLCESLTKDELGLFDGAEESLESEACDLELCVRIGGIV